MIQTWTSRFIKTTVYVCCCFLLQLSMASTAETEAKFAVFKYSENPMVDVQKTLDLARENKRLALIVLGANWCHDSRGLAKNFATVEMQKILDKHYQTTFIDVGHLEDRRDITRRFGQAHYFATPTVYIVDPKSERLLNAKTLKKWGMADNIPLAEYKSYFTDYATNAASENQPIGAAYKAQIDMFSQFQAHRLNQAYNHLRPMLIADDKGKTPANFYDDWKTVREFRVNLQKDLLNLEEQARKRVPLPLNLPTYQPFYWD